MFIVDPVDITVRVTYNRAEGVNHSPSRTPLSCLIVWVSPIPRMISCIIKQECSRIFEGAMEGLNACFLPTKGIAVIEFDNWLLLELFFQNWMLHTFYSFGVVDTLLIPIVN